MRQVRPTARLVFVLVVVVATIGVLEIGARLLGLGDASRGSKWYAGGNHPRFLFQEDANAGYALRPGFSGVEVASSGEFRVPISIDADGFPVRAARRREAGGILAVGDSMTFGEGVAQEKTWTALLERAVETPVANGGVPGYSSAQMAARTATLLRVVHPRLVLMAFFPQWDLWRCEDPLAYKDGFIVIRSFAGKLHVAHDNLYQEIWSGPHLGPWSARLLGSSAFLRAFMTSFTDRGLKARGQHRPEWSTYEPCVARVRSTQQLVEQSGATFRVVIIEGTGGVPAETTEVRRRLSDAGVPLISLDELMGGRSESTLRYKDGHWNSAGHAAVAEVLTPIVRGLLQPAVLPRIAKPE